MGKDRVKNWGVMAYCFHIGNVRWEAPVQRLKFDESVKHFSGETLGLARSGLR